VKIHTLQTNFAAGQLDETAQARSETPVYRNGAKELLNCVPYLAGGVRSRWGTRYLARHAHPFVLHAFEFNRTQTYIVAFLSNGTAHFYYADTGLAAGSVSGGPWTLDTLRQFRVAQLGDVMWVVHGSWQPREIVRLTTNTWLLRQMAFDLQAQGTPMFRFAPSSVYVQSGGGGFITSVAMPALPTVSGTPVPLYVGQPGRARTVAGPGPWLEFTVGWVSGLTIGVNWLAGGIGDSVSAEWQFEGVQVFDSGYGGTPPAPPNAGELSG
jgi:hypothetical protein